MTEQFVEIEMSSGRADGVLIRPDIERPLPGVIHLTDIGGIRESHMAMARQLAGKGYVVLIPNLFYRTGGKAQFQRPPEVTREVMMAQIARVVESFTPGIVEEDGGGVVDFLLRQEQVAKSGTGVVGYCFSGALGLRFAAARPQHVAAAASFHGGDLYTDSPTSPHLVLARVKARLYFGYADKDPYMSAEAIGKFEGALQTWGGAYQSDLYEGAFHSWTVPDSPVYNAAQAGRAFEKLTALLSSTLE